MKSLFLFLVIGALAAQETKDPMGRQVYYSGKVQGVGFRDTAVAISRKYTVTGWVKNLPDGRVQLVAEGPTEAVEDFLKAIRTRWKDNIEKEQVTPQPASGKYKTFSVMVD